MTNVPPGERVALCLSGGGYRAAMFHLGSLRRLNELGILSLVDTVSAVSGGSMLAAHLASYIQAARERGVSWPPPGEAWPAFDAMAESLHAKIAESLPLIPVLSTAVAAVNSALGFGEVLVRKMPVGFKQWVGGMRLGELPERPDFVFNATELDTGQLWSFSRTAIGSESFGYTRKYPHALVAEAVAASAAFPVFDPLAIGFQAGDFEGGSTPRAEVTVLLTDGGVFDNLGVEKVWDAGTILISDGGRGVGPLPATSPSSAPISGEREASHRLPATTQLEFLAWLLPRWWGGRQSREEKAHLEELSGRFASGKMHGVYWSIGGGIDSDEAVPTGGYAGEIASTLIATIRTQLDAFTDAERHILENHGYLMTEAAIRMRVPALVRRQASLAIPWPEALDPEFVRRGLRNSGNLSSGWRWFRDRFGR